MVTDSLVTHFAGRGIPLIPLDAGATAFVTEVDSAVDATTVLIAAGVDPPQPKLAAEITVNHAYRTDHAPAGIPVLPLAVALEWTR